LTFCKSAEPDDPACKVIDLALLNTDTRLAAGKSITPAFLFAALLWPVLQIRLARSTSTDAQNQHMAMQQAADAVIQEQLQYTAIPKRFTIASREIWELQSRLARRNKRSINSAYNHPRFRAAYDFLLLREEAGEDLQGLGQWWTDYQTVDPELQADLTASLAPAKKPRRRRRRKKPAGDGA